MKKYILIFILLILTPLSTNAAITSGFWNSKLGTYLETVGVSGYNILINGYNKYLNFGTTSGSAGYGFRDNSGTIQVKNSGGSWTNIPTSGAGLDSSDFSATAPITISTTSSTVLYGINKASSTADGYLSLTDWTTFNDKLSSYAETDPIWTAASSSYYLASNPDNYIDLTELSSTATGLTYTNTTGVFSLTSGYNIPITASTTNWNTSYNWGNHADGGYLTFYTETDPIWQASSSDYLLTVTALTLFDVLGQATSTLLSHTTTYNHANYDTAYGWGDHAGLYLPIGGGVVTGSTTINSTLDVTGNLTCTATTTFNGLAMKFPSTCTDGYVFQYNDSGQITCVANGSPSFTSLANLNSTISSGETVASTTNIWDFSSYVNATADTGIKFTDDAIGFDCSDVEGFGMDCYGEVLQIATTSITSLPNLTTIGTISSGIWNGTSIDNAYLTENYLTQTQGTSTYLRQDDYYATTTHENIVTLPSFNENPVILFSTSSSMFLSGTTTYDTIYRNKKRKYTGLGCWCDVGTGLLDFNSNFLLCSTANATTSVSITVTNGGTEDWKMGHTSSNRCWASYLYNYPN